MLPSPGLRYAIALSQMKGMTRQAAECLLQACGDIVPLFDESPERWREIVDAKAPLFDAEARQKALAAADREMEFIEKKNITPIFLTDPDYPSRLRECPDAPLMLYFMGEGNPNPQRVLSARARRHATGGISVPTCSPTCHAPCPGSPSSAAWPTASTSVPIGKP